MRLLILGGTKFVGRHLAEAAIAAGHSVTLFHRGQTNPALFPDTEHLIGDRDGYLDTLSGRPWDTVIDVCGYVPRVVQQSVDLLHHSVSQYVFISTISVYSSFSTPNQDENAPVALLPDDAGEEITADSYGPLKAKCEEVVLSAFPSNSLIIRPGLVAGPFDPTDRFTYWPLRAAQGGDMIAPGDSAQRIQYIDARDLAEWTVRMIGTKQSGTYNAVTSDTQLTMGELIRESLSAANTGTKPVWVDEPALLDQGLAPWSDLPLWLPMATTDAYRGMNSFSSARAVSAGLTFRSLRTTVEDTLTWANAERLTIPLKAGLSRQRENQILLSLKEGTAHHPGRE